jgi:hypothetical protein
MWNRLASNTWWGSSVSSSSKLFNTDTLGASVVPDAVARLDAANVRKCASLSRTSSVATLPSLAQEAMQEPPSSAQEAVQEPEVRSTSRLRREFSHTFNDVLSHHRDSYVAVLVLLSYTNLASDLLVASTLLGTTHNAYGVASLSFLGSALVLQLISTKIALKVPLLSKDMLLTAVFAGPALQAYRVTRAKQTKDHVDGYTPKQVLASMKLFEVALESLPELVLQLMLLVDSSFDGWSSPALVVSLVITILSSAALIVDAEVSLNGSERATRRLCTRLGI